MQPASLTKTEDPFRLVAFGGKIVLTRSSTSLHNLSPLGSVSHLYLPESNESYYPISDIQVFSRIYRGVLGPCPSETLLHSNASHRGDSRLRRTIFRVCGMCLWTIRYLVPSQPASSRETTNLRSIPRFALVQRKGTDGIGSGRNQPGSSVPHPPIAQTRRLAKLLLIKGVLSQADYTILGTPGLMNASTPWHRGAVGRRPVYRVPVANGSTSRTRSSGWWTRRGAQLWSPASPRCAFCRLTSKTRWADTHIKLAAGRI